MLSKKEIKDIQSLSQKKYRKETGRFLAEGPKIVEELLSLKPERVELILATPAWLEGGRITGNQIRHQEVSENELARVSPSPSPNQVLAVVKQWEAVKPLPRGFILYLDTIQDPGNFGTILRTADWFGITNVVCSSGCADLYNPKVVQSTMASLFRVNVFYDKEEHWLNESPLPLYAATLEGTSLYKENKVAEGVLLIGNESKGIRQEWMAKASRKITIPRVGGAESLNAAVATGIILSHLLVSQA